MRTTLTAFAVGGWLAATVSAHSWLEQLQVIDSDGNYTGNPGYPRGYVARGTPGYGDSKMTYLLPALSSNRIKVDNTDMLCMSTQRQVNSNTVQYPSLSAAAGNYVALKYLENGHVSLPQTQVGKPGAGGLVYVYATTKPSPDQKITDVLNWTSSGDLSTGRLLTIQNFDDGRCYQLNPNSKISVSRQASNPDPSPGQPASKNEQWCETDIQIPSDAPAGSLALYWVWQWPTLPGMDPGIPYGKDEIYTTCSDVNIVASSDTKSLSVANTGASKLIVQDPQPGAVVDFKDRAANLTQPSNTMFFGVGGGKAGSSAPVASPSPAGVAVVVGKNGTVTMLSTSVATTTSRRRAKTVTIVATVTAIVDIDAPKPTSK